MFYVGIDIGGTNIKAGIISANGQIIVKDKIKTFAKRHYSDIIKDIGDLVNALILKSKIDLKDISSIGIGCAGTLDSTKGTIVFSSNLYFRDVPIRDELQKYINLPIFLENDANVAALAEARYGASKGVSESTLFTLGTGVGGGIIINNNIYSGFNGAGSELGHMVLSYDGEQCACGKKGCFERYASAAALVRQCVVAAKENTNSLLYTLVDGDLEKMNAKIPFQALEKGDAIAKKVLNQYIDYLATGIASYIDIMFPELIVIGGGLGNEGKNLMDPLNEKVAKLSYRGTDKKTKIIAAKLGNDAGIIGAAILGQ